LILNKETLINKIVLLSCACCFIYCDFFPNDSSFSSVLNSCLTRFLYMELWYCTLSCSRLIYLDVRIFHVCQIVACILDYLGAVFFFWSRFFFFQKCIKSSVYHLPVVYSFCSFWSLLFMDTGSISYSLMLGLDEWNPFMKIIRQIWF
jgi:hypothetical protein